MGSAMKRAVGTSTLEKSMKIKSNVRAGKAAAAAAAVAKVKSVGHSSQINNTVVSLIASISRCVGL
jgi:hypothetical protein